MRLISDIRIETGQERRISPLAQAPDMHLQVGGKQSGILDLDGGVGGRDQHTEMSHIE
jgi:hypothetical protein